MEEPHIGTIVPLQAHRTHFSGGNPRGDLLQPRGSEGDVGQEAGQRLVVRVGVLPVECVPPPELRRPASPGERRGPEAVVEMDLPLVLLHVGAQPPLVVGQPELGQEDRLLGGVLVQDAVRSSTTATSSLKPSLDPGRR